MVETLDPENLVTVVFLSPCSLIQFWNHQSQRPGSISSSLVTYLLLDALCTQLICTKRRQTDGLVGGASRVDEDGIFLYTNKSSFSN